MHRRLFAVLLCFVAAALAPAAHAATGTQENPFNDQGSSPNFRSLITGVTPHPSGLGLEILQFSDRLRLINHTGQTVTVFGYQHEPYARILPDGTVQQNTRSPAYYLNQSFYGNVSVPSSANASAAPEWTLVDRTGIFEWHDHRIHWMSPVLPPQVKDKSKRVKIFDWNVPIAVGATSGAISGQLFWTPESSSFPVAAIVALVVVVALSVLFVAVVRRRRRGGGPPAGAATEAERPVTEAW